MTDRTKELFEQALRILCEDENYVQRPYRTVGGMWTTETWAKDGIRYQLMDEGYTRRIVSDAFGVTVYWNCLDKIEFSIGSEQELEAVVNHLKTL